MGHVVSILLAMGVAGIVASPAAAHLEVTFTRVADTSTPFPGGTGTFTSLWSTVFGGGAVAFLGANSGTGAAGIYTDAGGALRAVVDGNTPIPGGTGNFEKWMYPSIAGGVVAFGAGPVNQRGFYRDVGGIVEVVADTSTTLPGGAGLFVNFGHLGDGSTDGANVAFSAEGQLKRGVYVESGGVISLVADTTTAIPGGTGSFTSFEDPSLGGGDVAFNALGAAQKGIYTRIGGSLAVVADQTTAVPGGTGNFIGFGRPSIDGGKVAFDAAVPGDGLVTGVYTNVDGALRVVADQNTPVPGGVGYFNYFDYFEGVSLDGGNVAFWAEDPTRSGIYIEIDGVLYKVVDNNDVLDGDPVLFISTLLAGDALSGNQIGFEASFAEGSAIYVATFSVIPHAVPALGPNLIGLTVLVMGTWSALRVARRRR